jgi:hypothetical protein
LNGITANQGGFIEGNGEEAFRYVAEHILAVVFESNKDEMSREESASTRHHEGIRVQALEEQIA